MRRKKFIKHSIFAFILIGFSCFVSLAVIEIILRIFTEQSITPGHTVTHETRRYELKPDFSGKTRTANLKINSYGLRDYERPISKKNEAYRIGIFGDSITFGIGATLEDTFPKVLEKKLNAFLETVSVQVFNMGIGGYNTVQEYIYLTESYEKFRPHMAIFQYTACNDSALTNFAQSADINKIAPIRWTKDILRNLYSYQFLASEFYGLLYKLTQERKHDNEYITRMKHDEFLVDDDFKGWIENKAVFASISKFCQEKNIDLIFAVLANNTMLAPSFNKDPYYSIINKVMDAMKGKGISHRILIDDSFRRYAGKEKELWVTDTDSHFSPLAHRLVADALFQYICDNNFIEN